LFGLLGKAQSFRAAQRFTSDKEDNLRPVLAKGHMQETRIAFAKDAEFFGIRGSAENHGGTGSYGSQNLWGALIFERTDDDKIGGNRFVILPKITGDNGKAG